MQPVISLKDIRVTLGQNFSLSVESLVLEPHRIYALTGPNGAGKSTLLRVMALLLSPQAGTIEFAEGDSRDLARQRQRVTLVEQTPYLFEGSVTDNLNFGLKLRGINSKERSERIRATLAIVGLEGFEHRRAKELSGGEVQRVALARALVLKPELLLLDEPTANIDSNSLQAYEALLSGLPEYGVTVVFSTHDPSQSKRL
ncbi:MAG: ABC transporter ATP-binding protein [Deltaproteobacteria bacterium]|jgi:tungstate transport system ATP-binding protein|nr:ABC transporter ATP-binding protein [Deltaproteobacteria bacterium]